MDQPETYVEHLDNQLSKPYSDYKKNYYRICKIEFLTAIGRPDQVEELVAQSMDIVEIRQTEVNKAISAGNYESAKDLINEGISIAKEKIILAQYLFGKMTCCVLHFLKRISKPLDIIVSTSPLTEDLIKNIIVPGKRAS